MSDSAPQTTPDDIPSASQAAPPPQEEPHLTQAYRAHVDALLQGKEAPAAGTAEVVDDLKACAQKQGEARQALQQASQFAQSKQAEVVGLEGEATALLRVLKRLEDAAARET